MNENVLRGESYPSSLIFIWSRPLKGFYWHECVLFIRGRHPPEVWKCLNRSSGLFLYLGKVYTDAICCRPPVKRAWMQKTKACNFFRWAVFLIIFFTNCSTSVESGVPRDAPRSQRLLCLTVSSRCIVDECESAARRRRCATSHCCVSFWRHHLHLHTLICCFHSLTLVLLGASEGKGTGPWN